MIHIELIPPFFNLSKRKRPSIKNAGAYFLPFNCRGQLQQMVIPLPELPDPVDTRIPRQSQ